jgi:hypothetical protein
LVTTPFRVLVGGIALFAGLWFLSATLAAPILPKDTYKKSAKADIAQLQKHLAVINGDPKEAKRFGPTVKSLAMMLAMYGEATGDEALRGWALKVGEASSKLLAEARKPENDQGIRDASAAVAKLAKDLVVKAGNAPLTPANLQNQNKFALDEVMSPFRAARVGGLNIDRDIKDMTKKEMPAPIDPAAVELLAARTIILGEYMQYFPNAKVNNAAKMAQWANWSKETVELSKQLAEESVKGKKADETRLLFLLKKLEENCAACHAVFRD